MKIRAGKFIVIFFIIGLACLASLFKDKLVKSFVDAAATRLTGADVEIKSLNVDILESTIKIAGLKVYNPVGFPKEAFIDIPSVQVEYDLSALLKKKLYLPSVDIYLKELVVIKDKQGRMNVNSLKFAQKKAGAEAVKQEAPALIPMKIDLLKLNIGRVINKDFSVKGKPLVEVYDINMKRVYKNIPSSSQLAALILVEPLKQTAIKGAQVYGIATLAGVAALPVGVASVLIGTDSAKADFQAGYDKAYKASLLATDELGDIIKTNEQTGIIKGSIRGVEVITKISKVREATLSITVSARKYMFPKPRIAEGLLYEISQKLVSISP